MPKFTFLIDNSKLTFISMSKLLRNAVRTLIRLFMNEIAFIMNL
jgi:hypothetical protein